MKQLNQKIIRLLSPQSLFLKTLIVFAVALGNVMVLADETADYVAKAEQEMRMGKMGLAVRSYYRALHYTPAHVGASEGLSELLMGQRRFDDAQRVLDAALEAHPNSAELWLNQGLLLNETGVIGEAAKAYERAVELDPDNPGVNLIAAGFFQSHGQLEKAEAFSTRYRALTNE